MSRLKSLILNLRLGATCSKRDFDLRLWDMWHQRFIFQFFWKIKKEMDWSDPQPDCAIQPKARGLLHMEREYFAHHIWTRLSGLEHLTASEQTEVLGGLLDIPRGRPRSNQKDVLTTWSTRRRPPSTRRLQDSAMKSSGTCQTRGSGTAYRHRMF